MYAVLGMSIDSEMGPFKEDFYVLTTEVADLIGVSTM